MKFIVKIIAVPMLLLSSAMGSNVNAQELYRWVDKDGKVHYSDMPPPANVKNAQQKKLGDSVIEQDKLPYAFKIAMQNYPVTLYTSDCGEVCERARALLNKRGIPFRERNPLTDGDAAKDLKELAGGLQVPTLFVGNNQLKGFQESGWNSALDDAGYPASNPLARPQSAPVKSPPIVNAPADAPPPNAQ